MSNNTKTLVGIVATAIIFSSLTYYFAPAKVEIREVEKIVKIKGETKIINRDIVRTITVRPDGTTITKEVDKSKEVEEKREIIQKDTKKSKIITRSKKKWHVSAFTDSTLQNFTLGVERRIIGDVYLGIQGNSEREVRFGIGFSF